ncbi:TetR/AcrR family transcriptional regulator [Actinocorallia sp. A-T 12471]|uniref:TetR/AcrR family transcriptional regulator n=1 Tax=Actinocorallia sp. A-T 12471 TaxID=3089813 RepID=UPI0029CB06FE|nr:TetR/AcrR family transcriptional regulator [Actinocorallia sp. A-T 12471]MDX6741266.1 TetR/AcrR family transcriptional regulator [Actinocorallia sp. A-T 12471]
MSPRHRTTPETVGRLLEVALAVFAREGREGFTMSAVIKESGVSSGSLYHHFGSFDGLAAALYARCMGELLEAILTALEPCEEAADGVRAVPAAYLAFAREQRDRMAFIHVSDYAAFLPAHAETVAAVKGPLLARMAAWAAPHVAAGRVVDLSPALLEMLLIGPVAETVRRWLAGAPGIDIAEAERVLPERVWRSVRA